MSVPLSIHCPNLVVRIEISSGPVRCEWIPLHFQPSTLSCLRRWAILQHISNEKWKGNGRFLLCSLQALICFQLSKDFEQDHSFGRVNQKSVRTSDKSLNSYIRESWKLDKPGSILAYQALGLLSEPLMSSSLQYFGVHQEGIICPSKVGLLAKLQLWITIIGLKLIFTITYHASANQSCISVISGQQVDNVGAHVKGLCPFQIF